MRLSEQEADIRPVTPSKIPVGAFRVEEEKAINRALSAGPGQGSADSNRQAVERSSLPAAPSRIPKFGSGLGANYRRVQVHFIVFFWVHQNEYHFRLQLSHPQTSNMQTDSLCLKIITN